MRIIRFQLTLQQALALRHLAGLGYEDSREMNGEVGVLEEKAMQILEDAIEEVQGEFKYRHSARKEK